MPKAKASKLRPLTRRDEVEAAIDRMRKFFAFGASIPATVDRAAEYGTGVVDEKAKKAGMSADAVRKARQLVDPVAGYSAAEFAELCELVLRVQSRQDHRGPVFGRSHLCRLLSVTPRSVRAKLARKAIKEGWSMARLNRAIATRYGRRRQGGRRPSIPADREGLLVQIDGMCEQWRRWQQEMERCTAEGESVIIFTASPSVAVALKQALAAIGKLQTATSSALQDLRDLSVD